MKKFRVLVPLAVVLPALLWAGLSSRQPAAAQLFRKQFTPNHKSDYLFVKPAPPFVAGNQAERERFYEIRSARGKRFAGARLRAMISAVPKPKTADEIRIDWTLDYNGPRPPLIVLKPSLETPGMSSVDKTVVLFYAEGKDGRIYQLELKTPAPFVGGLVGGVGKDTFLKIAKGKTATGTIRISARKVSAYYQNYWPKQFDFNTPPILRVQLLHQPYHRFGPMDAWTGRLFTKMHKVELKKW